VRTERAELARQLPAPVLADYDKLLKARGGLALAQVVKPNLCGGCRMTVTPQRLQELRAQSALLPCESCGRYLYWLP
jgi:predicted  nucleic acid-binding Zn-ribbon protein